MGKHLTNSNFSTFTMAQENLKRKKKQKGKGGLKRIYAKRTIKKMG